MVCQTEENYQKAAKNLGKETVNVEKARQLYVSKSVDRDKAEAASNATGAGKDPKKAKEKFLKLDKEANVGVMDYRRGITEWEKVRDRWMEEMKVASRVSPPSLARLLPASRPNANSFLFLDNHRLSKSLRSREFCTSAVFCSPF